MTDPDTTSEAELTIDELAARVGMTVRNVRAYAGRGLIPAPRLAGRTGYYNDVHVSRLRLVRELLDRGYTLAAVEKAVLSNQDSTAAHALDLLEVLESPVADDDTQVVSRDALAAMAGTERDDALVDQLVGAGLVEVKDDDSLLLLQPSVVRAGTSAIAIGLSTETVMTLLPTLSEHLGAVAQTLVDRVRAQVWQPFVEAEMPEDRWPEILGLIEGLLPVAGQAVLAVFRRELATAIEEVLGAELRNLGEAGAPA